MTRHDSELRHQRIQVSATLKANRQFEQEDQHIDSDQEPGDKWSRKARLIVAKRNHSKRRFELRATGYEG
jgi:hypothetical protein